MDFDRLLEHFDETGQKERVALIIYYYEKNDGRGEVTLSDVKDVIRQSRLSIKISSVSKYLSRLEEAN